MKVMEGIKSVLIILGGGYLLIVIISVVASLLFSINELIEDLRYVYHYKHRFDKSPTAKCYCIDCENYNVETQRCYGFHEDSCRLVADNMFCYRAEPRKRESK